jgi:hypothetical protein
MIFSTKGEIHIFEPKATEQETTVYGIQGLFQCEKKEVKTI